jgi:hypothetical protein
MVAHREQAEVGMVGELAEADDIERSLLYTRYVPEVLRSYQTMMKSRY